MNINNNPPLQTTIAWAIITILSVFGIFAPGIFGIKGFDGGFAISFVCIFLAIIGIIVVVIYIGRARLLNRILSGENTLAHWKYSPEEWRKYTEKEYKEERQLKRGLFYVISGIAVLVGIIFFLADHKGGLWVLVAMLGLVAIIAFTAWFTSWYNYRQNKKYLGETYITEEAVYINRQLHTWRGLGTRLDSVNLAEGKPSLLLKFVYSAPTRTGMQEYKVNVPVPAGEEEAAEKILKHFKDAAG
jgi:MFS family permease